jgi:hypothetical protein
VYYVYDSYLTPTQEWYNLLGDDGPHSVRNTPFDGHFIGLAVERTHLGMLAAVRAPSPASTERHAQTHI